MNSSLKMVVLCHDNVFADKVQLGKMNLLEHGIYEHYSSALFNYVLELLFKWVYDLF